MKKLALSDDILLKIEKPARYLGNEVNHVVKDPEGKIRFAMCFPDVYEIGMSHLGIQILYDLLNAREDVYCERVYSPWPDLHKIMKEQNIPLFGLESQEPIKDFDFLGITIQYEMCYTNILQVLDLSGIPMLAADRGEDDPIVIGGGPCAYNPEPLADFFDIRKDSRALFDGLYIAGNKSLCAEWMNQCPVIFLTLKNIDGLKFESAYDMLTAELADLFKQHSYLLDLDQMDASDRSIYERLKDNRATTAEIKKSLSFLTRIMAQYYHKPVILLLDEYDVPIAKADSKGYYDQMLEIISPLLGTALKDNEFLKFAVITGCLRITKESIFTGTNNFITDTISDNRYNEFFGFTQPEVTKLLTDTHCEACAAVIQKWYDGYHFGNLDIYCPWDVLNYIQKVMATGTQEPENFWEHTSDNSVIRTFLERTDFDVTEKFETLLNGGTISEAIEENLTYNVLTSSEQNLWSLLYLTGYLTKVGSTHNLSETLLKIPNHEVMSIFQKSVTEWFSDSLARSNRSSLFEALWNEDADKLTEILSDLLFNTISYHDYAESFYHAFVAGLFANAGYIVESNYENGLGRSDLVIKDRKLRRAIVIELKIAKNKDCLADECYKALQQIEEKKYATKIEQDGFKKVIRYGIAFYKKECLVM